MVCMSNNTPYSPSSPNIRKDEGKRSGDDPLVRMEDLVKLQERRQQRLLQLRELRQGKPVSLWTSDPSDQAKLSPSATSPIFYSKANQRKFLSKSLPPNLPPPPLDAPNKTFKKFPSTTGRVEGRGRTAVPGVRPLSREESPHPARLLTRIKSIDAPADNVDTSKRPVSKTRPASAQMQRKSESNSRQGGSNLRAAGDNSGHYESPAPSRASNGQTKELSRIMSDLNEVINQAIDATSPGGYNKRETVEYSRRSTSKTNNTTTSSPYAMIQEQTNGVMQRLPSNQASFLKMFDNDGDINYSRSAEELSHLIVSMQAEFQTLREAKANAEAIANKLQTDLSLQQEESDAQLIALSSENERLKSSEFEAQLKLDQEHERANRAEKEKCAIRSRLLQAQNEKITAETKATMLEVENASLRKALESLVKGRSYEEMSEVFDDDMAYHPSARSA